MEVQDLINEVVTNAPVDKAGKWSIEASQEFPELFAAIIDHLEEHPSAVLAHVSRVYPVAMGLFLLPHAQKWMGNLQQFLRETVNDK